MLIHTRNPIKFSYEIEVNMQSLRIFPVTLRHRGKMGDPRLASRHLVYYCDDDPAIRANTAYLLGAFLVRKKFGFLRTLIVADFVPFLLYCCCRYWSLSTALTMLVLHSSAYDLIHFHLFVTQRIVQWTILSLCAIVLRRCSRL